MIITVLGLFLLSACAGREEEKKLGQTRQKKESSAEVSQFSDIDGTTWQDSWVEKTASGVAVNIDINAYTTIPDLKRMSVVEVEKYEFDNKNKKELLEGLFGTEIWYCENKSKKAPKDFVKLKENDYKGNQYLGERDGIRYRLSYETSHVESENSFIYMEPYDWKDVAPDTMKEYTDIGVGHADIRWQSENQCRMSKEEAEEAAKDFMQKAGFPDLVKTDEGVLRWDGDAADDLQGGAAVDGWYFAYSSGVEGAAFTASGVERGARSDDAYYHRYPTNCGVRVCVTDKGVIKAEWDNPIRILSSVTGVKLLPFDTVKEIIRSQMTEYAAYCYKEYYSTQKLKSLRFDRMELVYCRVSDPDSRNRFTYVPAWRLRNNNGEEVYFMNAVDGSLIREWEVIWGELKMW